MKNSTKNDKLLLLARICAIVCSVWTIAACVLVIRSGGEMSAGYAVIPCVFTATFVAIVGNRSRAEKRGGDDSDNINSDNINKE